MEPGFFVVRNCCDSHVHWAATGESRTRLNLAGLKSAADFLQIKIEPSHFRGEWLTGFGWDQNLWASAQFPDRHVLDQRFGDRPVYLTRADGHAAWVNTAALKLSGIWDTSPETQISGGTIVRDVSGVPTGVLIDLAMEPASKLIPSPSSDEIRDHLIAGIKIFNAAGFTHVRDLSCSQTQWNQSVLLDQAGELTLVVDQFFEAEGPKDFDRALNLALSAKKSASERLRVKGIKTYFDGALGSEGALLSQPYCHLAKPHRGLALLDPNSFSEILRQTWEAGLEVAVHAIGDEAAAQIMDEACRLWDKGQKGFLHIEHGQMIRPETIAKMKGRTLRVHMQPCHWLSDRRWLDNKLGALTQHLFPWQKLEASGVPFDFGSDSPIEPPDLFLNLEALSESSRSGIAPIVQEAIRYHSHSDPGSCQGITEFRTGRVHQVQLAGRIL